LDVDRKNTALLTTAYFGNIHYYSKFYQYDEVLIESHENFQKQSYRNRCDIYAANGRLTLTVPVIYSNRPKTKIKDVRIDYATDWQKMHFRSIESAYRSSPFYEFFMDEFMFVFEQKEKFLFEMNQKITDILLELLQLSADKARETITFIQKTEIHDSMRDFRSLIHPKSKENDPDFKIYPYHQVFEEKHGFIENLSVLDLLFNEGGNSGGVLKNI
jgi:hypothetical protein